MKIKNVSGQDRTIVLRGQVIEVAAGEVIDIPAAVAGRPPEARVAACDAELVENYLDHFKREELAAEWTGLDHGEGLLAQVDIWQAEKASKKEPAE